MRYGKIILFTVMALVISDLFCSDIYARRGGGFRSSSSRSGGSSSAGCGSSRRSSASRTSTWRSQSKTPQRNSEDQKSYEKAQAAGTAFSSKSEATAAFKTKYGSQYSANFASKPPTRPDYIPQSASLNGRTYPIEYNQSYGSYGYMGPGRAWVTYDATSDPVMLNRLMSRNNYYYDRYPNQMYGQRAVSSKALLWLGIIFATLLLVGGAALVLSEAGMAD